MVALSTAHEVPLRTLRSLACRSLQAAGIENAEREADWLLANVLSLSHCGLLVEQNQPISGERAERAMACVRRRAAREPLQYILGTQEFRGLEFLVTPDVLIPRPETELLVEETAQQLIRLCRPVVADIGTGSGCIAVALAHECPGARIYASDISAAALGIATQNAIRHVGNRIQFLQADLLEIFMGHCLASSKLDVIVSNPPYIAEQELPHLQAEVSRYEPHVALSAGPDGLLFYRRLLEGAPLALKPGGLLILELGFAQTAMVRRLVEAAGFSIVQYRQDAAGIERVLVLRKAA
jgi:release factor glutamine methyltransferase